MSCNTTLGAVYPPCGRVVSFPSRSQIFLTQARSPARATKAGATVRNLKDSSAVIRRCSGGLLLVALTDIGLSARNRLHSGHDGSLSRQDIALFAAEVKAAKATH